MISLHRTSGGFLLEISDEGRGISAGTAELGESAERIGVGIAGIRERLRELGGRLEIESDSHGTVVRVSLPLEIKEVA